jgi:hypothetical protein
MQIVKEKKILKWILEQCFGVVWTGFIWLRTEASSGFCKNGDEFSGYIKLWKFLL